MSMYEISALLSVHQFATATRSKLEMKKAGFRKITIASVCIIISICFSLSIIILSVLKLPQLSQPGIITTTHSADKLPVIGKFGKMMIDMLPGDLAFTVFLPSEEAFGHVLKLKVNESLKVKQLNDTLAILSRVLGFSAVPRTIHSADVQIGREMDFDSLSGFRLSVWKEEDGRLLVNRIRSRSEDLRVRETVVHVMDGVIMDADFEQSFQEEEED
ncbi:unnamed protein product [Rhodiola kirilowii]